MTVDDEAGPRPASRREWARAAIVAGVVALAAGALTGVVVTARVRAHDTATAHFSPNRSVFLRPGNVPQLALRTMPSVVSIETILPSCSSNPLLHSAATGAAGTGMIVSASGDILTNNHVVALATSMAVFIDGVRGPRRATLVGSDPQQDVALIHVAGLSHLPVISFAEASSVAVGERVVAIGNALALSAHEPSVTAGIISGDHRQITAGGDCAGTERLTGLLQTQAAINAGNSGGPLFDADGRVVGMNTAGADTATGGGRAQNVGFAIPVGELRALLPGLLNGGSVGRPHGFLGVEVESLTTSLRSSTGVPVSAGAVVSRLSPGGPAAAAGMRAGEVIVAVDGHRVTGAPALASLIRAAAPGSTVHVAFYRGSRRLERSIWLSSTPAPPS